jgi:FkbM family methyltransferase
MKIHTRSSIWRRGLRVLGSKLFHFAENNDRPQMEDNGEGWFLRQLLAAHAVSRKERPFVVCDAGANAGGYTRMVLQEACRINCMVEVHAFEPSPHCLEELRRIFAGEDAVRLVGAALADQAGEATLFSGQSGSTHASLLLRAVADPAGDVRVPLLRLEDYIRAHGIGHIDLLKLDIEGAELVALRGLGEYLRPEVVDVIQFEYGGTTLDAGTRLRDLYELLTSRGFVLAKIFPRFLEQRVYADWMEHFAYANYAALAPRWLASGNGALSR